MIWLVPTALVLTNHLAWGMILTLILIYLEK